MTDQSLTLAQANRKAFLRMTGISEGTVTSPATRNDGYDVIVIGVDGRKEIFSDYSKHPFTSRPAKVINSSGLLSTASGRYQILFKFWPYYQKLLKLPDFSPASQDSYVVRQWQERRAISLIEAGDLDGAFDALSGLWASFPGRTYAGQHQNAVDHLKTVFTSSGGTLKGSL